MIVFAEASRDEEGLSHDKSVATDVVDSLVVKRLAQIRPEER